MDISQSPEGPNRTERQRKGDALTIEVQGYWDSRLWYLGLMLGVIPLAFLVLQFVDGRVWDLPASITVRAYFCNKYCHVYVYICIYTHTICHKRTIYMHVCVCVCVLGISGVSSSETPWIVALQGPLSMRFSGQEYWIWVAIYFSRGSSWPRKKTWVSCIAGGFFF